MKKPAFLFFFVCLGAASVFAQQLTRFAVVDLPKVYTAFFRDSRAVREFEERAARVQTEINKMTKDIQELKSKHADAVLAGDQSQALRLETEINKKSDFLREYYNVKTAELEEQKKKLSQSESFLDQVYNEIRYIAEFEGYSMVLNLKESTGILWYSPTVDITNKVIENLLDKSRR
ncbi:MAG: OmpH family outer membrane protein [Treponema sp.]|jgi:outer membrane protein|nr:OmpH family outer membrane protein [Treponema sp.]